MVWTAKFPGSPHCAGRPSAGTRHAQGIGHGEEQRDSANSQRQAEVWQTHAVPLTPMEFPVTEEHRPPHQAHPQLWEPYRMAVVAMPLRVGVAGYLEVIRITSLLYEGPAA